MRTLIVLCCALFAGCAGTVNPTQLESPAKGLMVPPKQIFALKAGEDLVEKDTELRRMYVTESGKLVRLQRYVKTVLQKK